MAIFSDPKSDKLEQISDRALPHSMPIVTPTVVTAGLGFAAFAASGSLATVGFVSIMPVVYAYQKVCKWMKAQRFEREHGSIAHLVKSDRDMIQYIKIVGEKKTAAQLLTALDAGQQFTSSAKKAAAILIPADQLPHANVTKFLESTSKIVDTQAREVTANSSEAKGVAAIPAGEKVTQDVVTAYLSDLRCTVLCAPPRTGKGIVATAMMMGFKDLYPAGVLFSSTIKQFAGEDWYFSNSDYHINPSVDNPVLLAKQLYALYTKWESSNSTKEAPSLLVIDELRDTLLALKGVEMDRVDPNCQTLETQFADWLKNRLISAATLNQCHRRYLLLIAPVSTASAMGFKDANSLRSYASFTLVTPKELAFTEGNNGTFAAPSIRADSELFKDWYGLAWSSKSREWLGVPKVDPQIIKMRGDNTDNQINYLPVGHLSEGAGFVPDGHLDPADRGADGPSNMTATKVKTKLTAEVEPTQEELENLVYKKLVDKLLTSDGEKTTLSKLRRSLSTKQQKAYTQLTEDLILEDERFDFSCRDMPDGNKSISIWLKDDSTNTNPDDE
jgi:hypothetical protein